MPRNPIGYNPEVPISQPLARNPLEDILPRTTEQNPDNSSYSDIMQRLTDAFGDDFIKYLNSLGINGSDFTSGGEIKDWNKQLLDTIIKYMLSKNERDYNRGLQLEQRQYDLPQAQLARLMAAGLSRDAAIKLLSGSGSGSGSGVPYASGLQAAEGLSPTESASNDLQNKLGIANTVFAGVQAVSSLVGLGFSIPQAIQQTKLLQNQNNLTSRQISAYEGVGSAHKILTDAGVSVNSIKSLADLSSSLTKLANDGNQSAKSFIDNGDLEALNRNAPYTSPTIAQLFKSENEAESYRRYLRQQELQNDILLLDAGKISAESEKLNTENKSLYYQMMKVCSDIKVNNAQIRVLNAQGEWQEIANDYADDLFAADLSMKNEQARGLRMENEVTEYSMPVLKQHVYQKLTNELTYMSSLYPEDLQKAAQAWVANNENAVAGAYLESVYLNAAGDFAQQHPTLWALVNAFHKLPMSDMIRVAQTADPYDILNPVGRHARDNAGGILK